MLVNFVFKFNNLSFYLYSMAAHVTHIQHKIMFSICKTLPVNFPWLHNMLINILCMHMLIATLYAISNIYACYVFLVAGFTYKIVSLYMCEIYTWTYYTYKKNGKQVQFLYRKRNIFKKLENIIILIYCITLLHNLILISRQ